MSRKRVTMRRIKEVLRLSSLGGKSERDIARATNLKKSTVRDYLLRARELGITWENSAQMDDGEIEKRLFPSSTQAMRTKVIPDWGIIHRELRRKSVTLELLWEEYREIHPAGYGYSRFCELYQRESSKFDLSMRQVHRAGEKMFVDYSGQTIPIVDHLTGEIRAAQVFVAVLGASNYTFAEATWTQQLPDWIGSHVHAFRYFGGVPELLIPDNLKSGVTKASYYDPEINPTYQGLASHYGVAVLPTRAAHPKDKAKVEVGVQVVQRWILARLRNRTFFSLGEGNTAIAELLERLNTRNFRKLPGCRQSLFEQLEKPILRPLPTTPYEYAEWKKVTVGLDYHVEVKDHYYSVPYQLVRQVLHLRFTSTVVEVFKGGKRVAVHPRKTEANRYSTCPEHMPSTHRAYAEWTPSRVLNWAAKSGIDVARFIQHLMKTKPHPEQGFRAAMGIIRLEKKVGKERLNAACQRALAFGGESFRCVANILERGLDRQPLSQEETIQLPQNHENIRGESFFQDEGEESHALPTDR